jgi:thioredoxin reductase
MAGIERPFPPGEYPVVVVGSGPGGLQTSYALSRLGVEHAVISRDDTAGGMFRSWPVFGRLLSWTKPDAPAEPGTREHEWFDHNSLVGNEPAHRGLVGREMDRTWMVPTTAEMTRGLQAFAERGGVRVRYGCAWESTRREDDTIVLETSDGEYRCRAAVFAIGVTEPWRAPTPGLDLCAHYVETREPQSYRGKTVVVIGKRNSGFELADGLVPWARQVILASPSPVRTSVIALATVRVRYMQPYEDASWGGGTLALDAAIERVERNADGYRIHARGTTIPGDLVIEADEAIEATGFAAPLRDLPDALGVATVSNGRVPALTHHWESVSAPGVYFAGGAMQGSPGIRKHGIGSASGTVIGFRYNARVLAGHLAQTVAGLERPGRQLDDPVGFLQHELTRGPELWAQKAYLARVIVDGRDEGVEPLGHFLDAGGPDAVAATIEMDPTGAIYPALYLRRRGHVTEHLLDPDPRHDYTGAAYRRPLERLLS